MGAVWQERLDTLKAVIEADIAKGDYYGAVLKVGRGGVLVFDEAIGHAYAGGERPLKKDDVFSLFSTTKAFTNVLIMRAIEEGRFQLRRGFEIPEGARVLMVEDIVTTGLSSRECLDAIKNYPGQIVGAACLIDRSGGKADLGVPLVSLAQVEIPTYAPDQLPPDLAAIPAVKPGSRNIKA